MIVLKQVLDNICIDQIEYDKHKDDMQSLLVVWKVKILFGFTNVIMKQCFHKENKKCRQCYNPISIKHFVDPC